ncbi:hypothetical protein O1L68_18040 [Streptomyces lydicus]|nr:hypothetical protein [Streptomyces lydicus]
MRGLRPATAPSYRGLAFRGTDAADAALAPGNLLREAAPVSALPVGVGAPRPGGPQYAIWSATGRRVRSWRAGRRRRRDEVVFAPGSLLRVLDVRESDGAPLVLLREVPATPPPRPPQRCRSARNSTTTTVRRWTGWTKPCAVTLSHRGSFAGRSCARGHWGGAGTRSVPRPAPPADRPRTETESRCPTRNQRA